MSVVQTILQKAKSDLKFATLIIKDPVRTLAPYKLTTGEQKEVVEKVKTLQSKSIWPED